MLSSSHKNSNKKDAKSVFHHFCPVLPASLTLCLINRLAPEFFFFKFLAHPEYKMWIKQEPNTLELWNKLHFEEKETESIYRV